MTEIQQQEDDPNAYVEYEIEWKDGMPISCKFAGEGRQAEPMPPHPIVFQRLPGEPVWPRKLERIERAIQRAFRRLAARQV